MNREEFRRVIKNALIYTEKNNDIVTISIKPFCLETSYGYVESSLGRRRFIAKMNSRRSQTLKQQRNILLLAIIFGIQVYWYGVPIPLQNALVSINQVL